MMSIREKDFRGVDLNLLVTLAVLLRERSVSRAAACLHLGQPAVSGALARLRELFGDELLVRVPQGMAPTVRALALQSELTPLLERLQTLLFAEASFEPASAARAFSLGMSDWVEIWLAPKLLPRLRALAPKLRIALETTDPFTGSAMLEQGRMELGVSVFAPGPAWQQTRPLRSMGFAVVYDPKQLPLPAPLSLDDYLAHQHALVSYRGARQGTADRALAVFSSASSQAWSRLRLMSTPGFRPASARVDLELEPAKDAARAEQSLRDAAIGRWPSAACRAWSATPPPASPRCRRC
ncbi:LysR family transcriptional regulator [Chromobacterium phragmitis]|uniref:LysR family transcriptional regulator n=1 Tax=Chromobacterium phragmitis TaxID=2202141 RepID=A0ABV0IVY7_9NEIS